MIHRRALSFLRKRDWGGMTFELLVVALGVLLGIQASNWNDARHDRQRGRQAVAALQADLKDSIAGETKAIAVVNRGLAEFDAARMRGERPPPFYFILPGSFHAPDTVWDATLQSGLADLVPTDLLFDLGFYYSERNGIGDRYAHYATFVEDEIMPRLKGGPGSFYDSNGRLKPEFAANMDRLRDWRSYLAVSVNTENCLLRRFDHPTAAGHACRSDYGVLFRP